VRVWPPILWLPVYIASELILLGSHHRWPLLAAGGAMMLIAFGLSVRLSLGNRREHPVPSWFYWAVAGVAFCYIVAATAAGLSLGPTWALGALAAGIIPMVAMSLLLATVRSKTVATDSDWRDVSGDSKDPAPGIGLDDKTPLGDTSEHSTA
jgi:peptidoglycan/LPS O-acetylase OafA/YrhL